MTWSKTYRYLYPSINYLIWPFWRKPKTNKSPIKELVCVRCNQTNNRNIKEWSWTLLYVQVNHSQKVAFFHHFIGTFFRTAILSKNSNVFEHGLRTPNESFFHRNTKLLGLWTDKFLGIFGWFISTHFSTLSPLITNYFYKQLTLYIQIPKVNFGLRFEFGPQRIRDLKFRLFEKHT